MDRVKCGQERKLLPENKVKVLGVWISTDPLVTLNLNYTEKLEQIRNLLSGWKYFYYQNFILEVTIYLKNIFTAYDITFKFTKYYQPKQYENYQPRALAFSPSIQEQYIITIIITCLEEDNNAITIASLYVRGLGNDT